ncbi:MAG: HepT-like ribonuclease domain-containing protein [bacterium]
MFTLQITDLKDYLEKNQKVVLAFLFGSYAKGFEMEESDFDLGIYFKDYSQKEEDRIWFDVARIIKKEVDLVCLNEAPASLISSVFKTGIPLVIRDKNLYWNLYLKVSLEAEDFSRFVEDFERIKKRAKSLAEEEKINLRLRCDFLETEFNEQDRFKELSWKEYLEDRDKRRLIERWTENILNATIDIAKIILASEKKRMPRSYEEALFDFALLIGFDMEAAKKFSRFANLRNLLAHEYLDILYQRIQYFIQEAPEFYKRIFNFVTAQLSIDSSLRENNI